MSKRDLLIPAAVVLIAFIAGNVVEARRSRFFLQRQKINAIRQAPDANVLLVGNSTFDWHVDSTAFEHTARLAGENMIPVNAALMATQPEDQYLLFRQGMKNPGIRAVVIGFYDFQLTNHSSPAVADLTGFRAVAFDSRIDPRDADLTYSFPPAERLKFRIFRLFPLLAYRELALPVQQLRDAIRGPSPPQDDSFAIILKYFSLGGYPRDLNPPMDRIVHESAVRKARVVFVLVPMSPKHRADRYSLPGWRTYVDGMKRWMAAHQCGFIDASEWLPLESDFDDDIHFKRAKAGVFSVLLANALVRDRGMNSSSANAPAPRRNP
jgi:hypothetical protein